MYKKYFNNKKGVFFDLDGTLVNSSALWDESFLNILNNVGFDQPVPVFPPGLYELDKWNLLIDKSGFKFQVSARDLSLAANKEYIKLFEKKPVPVREGFFDLAYKLKTEKGMKLGLVSNSSKMVVEFVARKLGIFDYFDVVVTGEEVKRPKPNPDIYKLALKKIGLKSKEVLAFEDSYVGVDSAISAGIDTFAVWVDSEIRRDRYNKRVKQIIPGFEDIHLYIDTTAQEELDAGADFAKKYYRNMTKEEIEALSGTTNLGI